MVLLREREAAFKAFGNGIFHYLQINIFNKQNNQKNQNDWNDQFHQNHNSDLSNSTS